MLNLLDERLDAKNEQLLTLEKLHFEKNRPDSFFNFIVERKRTPLNLAYEHTRESIANHVVINNLTDAQYIEHIEYALSFLYDFNRHVQNSLGLGEVKDYTGFWVSCDVDITNDHIYSIEGKHPNLPKNFECIIPILEVYIKNTAIQSNHLDQVLIDFLAFSQLNAAVFQYNFQLAIAGISRKSNVLEKFFQKKLHKSKENFNKRIWSLGFVYIQCSKHMFNPSVIYELAIEIRKKDDFYEGVFFDLLEAQISRRKTRIRQLNDFLK